MLKKDVEQKFLTQTSIYHKVEINVKHPLGDMAVGLHPVGNPKVMVDVFVTDANGNMILTQTVQATNNLEKGSVITLPNTNNLSGASGKVRVCAKINSIHTTKGYNIDTSNDLLCADFSMAKNYAITDLRVSPAVEYLPEGIANLTTPLSHNFGIVNESAPEKGVLSESPRVTIRRGSTTGPIVWQGNLPAAIEKTTMHSVPIPVGTYPMGETRFFVEVNPDKTVTEFKPGVANPYLDNVRSISYKIGLSPPCIDCVEKRTSKTWTEKFSGTSESGYIGSFTTRVYWTEYTGKWINVCLIPDPIDPTKCLSSYSYPETVSGEADATYRYCVITNTNNDLFPNPISFSETYQVNRVWFRSKWSDWSGNCLW